MIRHVERLFGCELRYAEYILSGQAVLWGLWVGFPWNRPAEIVFGGVAVAFGGMLFAALRGERRQLRRWCCFALFVMWLLVAIEMLRSRPGSSDFPAYFGYNFGMMNRRYPQKQKARRSSLEYRLRRALFGLIVLAVLSAGYWLIVLIKSAWDYLR